MDFPAAPNLLFFFFLLSTLIVCSTGANPVIGNSPPGIIITVPSGNPATPVAPPPPATVSPAIPNYPPPPAAGPPPATGQGSWCVVKSSVSPVSIQAALDFACGNGANCGAIQPGGPCFSPSSSQNSLQIHAIYAFTSYCQARKGATCDFGGVAVLSNVDPSTGSCKFPALTTSTSPTTPAPPMTPTTPTPTTPTPPMTPTTPTPPMNPMTPMTPTPPSSLGGIATPPNTFNANSPPLAGDSGFGGNPQTSSTNSISLLSSLQQNNVVISCVILVASIVTGVIGFDM